MSVVYKTYTLNEPGDSAPWGTIENTLFKAIIDKVQEPYQQVVTVAKAGADYTSIQGAIDSITDASTSKRYTVLVMPGLYTEQVTLKDWVDLRGLDRRTTVLQYTGNNNGTIIMSDWSRVSNLNIEMTDTATEWAIVGDDVSNIHIKDVWILRVEGGSQISQGIKLTGNTWQTVFIENCVINYGGTTGYGIYLTGNSTTPQNADMHLRDIFVDAFNVNSGYGCVYVQDLFSVRIRSSLLRTSSNGFCLKIEDTSAGTSGTLLEGTTAEFNTSSCVQIDSGAQVLLKHSVIESQSGSGTLLQWASAVIN